ncbi:MAG: type II secretion system minor pseudopilin GspJ [Gammaproteobacteria bacterium]|nr:type II secretion system minor pseudopilin GspJ [Gammaproteobacteria bacterium]
MRAARGFTLVELLVAVFIVAIVFAMGYGAINQAVQSREILRDEQTQLLGLQNAIRLLEQDFVQAAPRPVRQPVGDEPAQAAMIGAAPGAQPVVAFTRNGWANPAGLQRPGLQRVAYRLENGTLRREYWNVLDPTLNSPLVHRDLLEHVKAFTVRYLDPNHQWLDQWPPLTNCPTCTNEQALRQRPLAVEVTIDTADWGKIVRIIEIAG